MLIGDAAHATSPHCGQGAAQAIEDGVVLTAGAAGAGDAARGVRGVHGAPLRPLPLHRRGLGGHRRAGSRTTRCRSTRARSASRSRWPRWPRCRRARMTRIDAHAHVLPPAYVEALGGVPVLPAPLEGLEAMMERHEIDAAVISTGPPGAFLGDAGRARRARARRPTRASPTIVRGAPDRFAGLALLPLPDVDAALGGDRARARPALARRRDAADATSAGTYLGDPAWDPVLAELDRRGAYVFVHPTLPPYTPPLAHHPVWLYEFPFETVRAISQLVYAGALERYPGIRFQFAHLGGAAPFLAAPPRLAGRPRAGGGRRRAGRCARVPAAALLRHRPVQQRAGARGDARGHRRSTTSCSAPTGRTPRCPTAATRRPTSTCSAPGGRAAVEAENIARLVPRLVGARA